MAACSAATACRDVPRQAIPDSSASAAGERLLRGVLDEALADELLDAGPADGVVPLRPPGAEQVADEQLRVERAAHREQLARRVQEFVEQRVGGRAATCLAATSALRAHPDSLSDLHM